MFSVTGPVTTSAVGVAGRGDELDAEPAQVEDDGAEHVQVGLAGVAAAGAHLAQLERAAEEPARSSRRGPPRASASRPSYDEVVAGPRGEAVVLAVADRALGAGLDAVGAEQAAAQVEPEAPLVERDGVGRAGLGAGAAAVRALGRVDDRQAAEAVRQERRLGRVRDRPVALPAGAREMRLEAWTFPRRYRSWPQYDRLKLLLHSGKSEICWSAQRQRQADPVVERRVDDLVAGEAALGVRQRDVADLAAPAFDERDREVVGLAAARRRARTGPSGSAWSCSWMNADRPLDLEPAHVGAGEDVAGRPGRDGDLGEAEDAGREIVPDVALDAAGAGRRADQAQGHGRSPR